MPRLAVLVFLILALPLHANLGDTVATCVKRYGTPNTFTEANGKSPFGTLDFLGGPYEMIIFLYKDVEVGVRVSKKDKSAFSPDEIQTILNSDATPLWVATASADPTSRQWARADKATATYDVSNKMLIITSADMVRELHAPPPAAAGSSAPPRPQGDFAPASPTQWAPPTPPSTNAAPATNAP